jgi:glycosyltransferase involved in cell wall biosynthesis
VRLHEVANNSESGIEYDLPRINEIVNKTEVADQYKLPLGTGPGVVVVHDLSFEDPRAPEWLSRAQILRYRATIRTSVRRAAAVIVSSEYTRADLLRHYRLDPGKVSVAPCAVDEPLARLLHDRPPRPPAPPYVLVVGNLVPRKLVVVLARAVARLLAAVSPVGLHLVGKLPAGGSPLLTEMQQALGAGFTATGHVTDDELADEYAGASVVCYPSLYEGFGLPLLEAMSAGVPVVASNATCLPEVAGDGALLVDPADPAAWAAAIDTLLSQPRARDELVAAGRRRVQTYSWDATADVLLAALDRAVSGRGR